MTPHICKNLEFDTNAMIAGALHFEGVKGIRISDIAAIVTVSTGNGEESSTIVPTAQDDTDNGEFYVYLRHNITENRFEAGRLIVDETRDTVDLPISEAERVRVCLSSQSTHFVREFEARGKRVHVHAVDSLPKQRDICRLREFVSDKLAQNYFSGGFRMVETPSSNLQVA